MQIRASKAVAWASGLLALAVILGWLTPAGITGQKLSGLLAGIVVAALTLVFAVTGWRAWPKPSRLEDGPSRSKQGAAMEEKKPNPNPLVEDNPQADARASELPEQPQEHIIRGYGAVNPTEGPLDEDRPR